MNRKTHFLLFFISFCVKIIKIDLKSWQLNEGNDILASKMVQVFILFLVNCFCYEIFDWFFFFKKKASKAKVFFNSPIHSIDLFIDKTIDSEQLNNEKENNGILLINPHFFISLYFFSLKPIGIWQKLKNVVLGDNNDNNNENNNDKMDENQTDDLKKRKIYSIQNQKCMLTLFIFFCSE